MLLSEAAALLVGVTPASRVYLGATQVWPSTGQPAAGQAYTASYPATY